MTNACRGRIWAPRYFLTSCLSLGLILLGAHSASGDDSELVYYSTNEFEINEFDRRMFLRNAPGATDEDVGSRVRNLQALSDLYVMEVLMSDAGERGLLSEAERDWIAKHAVQLAVLQKFIQSEVDRKLLMTDWDAEAIERFQASPELYQVRESVSVRTLLIRRDERTEEELLGLAQELLEQARQPGADFEELVRNNTEDVTAAANGGLMSNIERGQTVESFETAAFALQEKGQFSEPVVSQFGVHLIQLLAHHAPRQKNFEEVRQDIIDELKRTRKTQYREGIHMEARERKPLGFIEHTDNLDALMRRTSDGLLGPDS